jgi:anthranilate phosphoribosyltransferase
VAKPQALRSRRRNTFHEQHMPRAETRWSDADRSFISECLAVAGAGGDLTCEEARRLLLLFLHDEDAQVDTTWGFAFGYLAGRGRAPSTEEATGFLEAIAEYEGRDAGALFDARPARDSGPTLAVTGSGKDWPKAFNITTAAAILVATLGVRVVKPVAPSTGEAQGSEDVLRETGAEPALSRAQVVSDIDRFGIAFPSFETSLPRFFRRYTGRFPFITPLSFFLPPLAIPGDFTHLVYGLAHRDQAGCGRLLSKLIPGSKVAVVASGLERRVVDEFLPCPHGRLTSDGNPPRALYGDTSSCPRVHGLGAASLRRVLDPASAGAAAAASRDVVVANAAIYAWVANRFDSFADAQEHARIAMDEGRAIELLRAIAERDG